MATSSLLFSFGRPRPLSALVDCAFITGLAIVAPTRSFAAPNSRIPMATFCSKSTAGGKYGLATKSQKYLVKLDKEEQLVEATEWANEQLSGGSAASRAKAVFNKMDDDNEKRWPLLTFSVIRYRLLNEGEEERRGLTVLTGEEENHLVTWLNKCWDIGKPIKDLASITTMVRAIIKGRRIWNSHMAEENEVVPLSKAEEMQMMTWASDLSKTWESNFRARHAMTLDKKHAKTAESKRASKQTKAVVGRDFFGSFGLRRELIDARIMNPITNVILDPRSLMNFVKTPQMVDGTVTGSKKKAFGSVGKALCDDQGINREVVSVGICWGSDGFCYGPQFNIACKHLQAGFAVPALEGYKSFNDTISVSKRRSFFSHVVTSEKGVQTDLTFLDFLKILDKEITARSVAEVAAGNPPIERPVVLCVDNHGSRYDDEVLAAFGHAESEYGIRVFTEEPNTSQFLQLSFSADIINAWMKVGICAIVLAPEHINRDGFIDQHDPTVSRVTSANAGSSTASASAADSPPSSLTAEPCGSPTYSEYVRTPAGVASGSNEALLGKLARTRELHEHYRSRPLKFRRIFDPEAEGLLPIPERVQKQDKLSAQAATQAAKDAAKALREQKKQEEAAKLAEFEGKFARCETVCACGVAPCKMAKAKRCPTCRTIAESGRACGKAPCSAARKALAAEAEARSAPPTAAPAAE
ncbi:hypothetical protein T492DRAFT_906121 [Pavlovales sp. CCMP2436]|nr:hypothetical protein T492DRAFT_906121 [Pavlovales sp. CCMP2436]